MGESERGLRRVGDPAGGRAWLAHARAALQRSLAAGPASDGTIVLAQVEAPRVTLESALAALRTVTAESLLLWDPPAGASFAGAGAAARLQLDGSGISGLRGAAEALWARVTGSAGDAGEGLPPARLFGGLAFAAAAQSPELPESREPPEPPGPWSAHGRGAFVLPRVCYGRDGERAWLALAIERSSRAALEEADAAMAALAQAPVTLPVKSTATASLRAAELSPACWAALVEDARGEIAAGRLDKVVLARRTELTADAPFDAVAVLDRLRAAAAGCTRFAFGAGDAVFLGATPERLVSRRGETVLSEALAGSIEPAGAARLLAIAKERHEHLLTAREVVRRLAPFCDPLQVGGQPAVRRLRHLVHLHTPIEGRLRERTHVLDLAAALHPTPAVAGLPVAPALAWIAAHEQAPRGWYAGPIGWFDAAGDGDLAVGLRAALVRGSRAWVWAGAGLVGDSTADGEYAETALKQRAILDALGAVP